MSTPAITPNSRDYVHGLIALDEQVAIITGAASGQGRAACDLFAGAGAAVVVADWNGDGARAAADELTAAGGLALAAPTDISREGDVRSLVDRALNRFGRVDIVFNNAGVGYSERDRFRQGSVVETDIEAWDAVMRVNLRGAALMCKHTLPSMLAARRGCIINNASVNALVASEGADAYSVSKGGLVTLTRILACQWGKHGIRVNCLCPAAVDTPMIAGLLDEPEAAEFYAGSNPMGRIAHAEEPARVALFLASELASYVNGAIIPVDGGWTAR